MPCVWYVDCIICTFDGGRVCSVWSVAMESFIKRTLHIHIRNALRSPVVFMSDNDDDVSESLVHCYHWVIRNAGASCVCVRVRVPVLFQTITLYCTGHIERVFVSAAKIICLHKHRLDGDSNGVHLKK